MSVISEEGSDVTLPWSMLTHCQQQLKCFQHYG